jgi:hypothetical protein
MRATVPGRPSSSTGQSLALKYRPPPFDHSPSTRAAQLQEPLREKERARERAEQLLLFVMAREEERDESELI